MKYADQFEYDLLESHEPNLKAECEENASIELDNYEIGTPFYNFVQEWLANEDRFWYELNLTDDQIDDVNDSDHFWDAVFNYKVVSVKELVKEGAQRYCAGQMGLEFDELG